MGLAGKTSELISHLKRIEASQSPTAFACSFGSEDMVVLDAIARNARGIEVFTLDTGRQVAVTGDVSGTDIALYFRGFAYLRCRHNSGRFRYL